METVNKMTLSFLSLSLNEPFARSCISAFALSLNPTVAELNDIKTAVSEAVTNAIVHGYPDTCGIITLSAEISDDTIHITVADKGKGILDVKQALEPFFSTRPNEERTGMGFTVMQSFMDDLNVISRPDEGTTVEMSKQISPSK